MPLMCVCTQPRSYNVAFLIVFSEGDRLIEMYASNTFKKVKMGEKGIGFPTCVSVNNCVGHFSPLPEDPNVVLKAGDVVKMCPSCLALSLVCFISPLCYLFSLFMIQ